MFSMDETRNIVVVVDGVVVFVVSETLTARSMMVCAPSAQLFFGWGLKVKGISPEECAI